jgi:hypothetical protein
MSLRAKVERSVTINAYGNHGQRDEGVTVPRTIKTVGDQPQYVWVGNDRYNTAELQEALNAVRPGQGVESCGLYAPGTK